MHLTPSLLANPESGYGSHDHIIVHEWGHLRFGVFDEYPTILKKGILQRFYNEGGTWKPVRCTEEIQGFISTDCSDRSKTCRRSSDGQPEKACRFCINRGATTAKASLMGNQWLPTLQEFCDVDDPNSTPTNRHTSSSVNKQTTYCDGKSIWEILRTHSDIKGNTPGSQNQNTDPTFRLFQEKDDLIVVLVLDVSGSMSVCLFLLHGVPLQKLRQAATRYIMNTASNGTWLGIVKFNALATVSRVLTQITSVSVRESLTNSLPSSAAGSTSIGAGLEKGYEMIEAHRTNIIGSTLLLVTDGNENSSPYIADVKPDIVSKGIKVNTLAYGVNADPALEALAFATGGNSFFYTGSDNATGLDDAFDTLVTSKEQSLQILSSPVVLRSGLHTNVLFLIDANTGRDITVRLSLTITTAVVNITIETPSGMLINKSSTQETNNGIPSIQLEGDNEEGEYQIQLSTDSTLDIAGTILVTSKRKNSSTTYETVELTGWLSDNIFDVLSMKRLSLYASLQKGYAPIVYGNVSALIEDGTGNTMELKLKDDGIGSDVEANDGVYSASILPSSITSTGRHFVKVIASNLEGKAKLLVLDEEQSDLYEIVPKEENVVNFQREKVIEGFSVNSSSIPQIQNDDIPPSRITTLSIRNYSTVEQVFTLEWVAPGDDFEYGQVSGYDIRIAENFQRLRQDPDSENMLPMPTRPKMAGEIEIFIIKPNKSEENVTYYIGIRGIDEMDNYGEMSNILSISVLTDPQWLSESDTDQESNGLSLVHIVLIAVGAFVFLLVVIICFRKCQGGTKQDPKQAKSFTNNAYVV
ncbi:hypothetical protein FSP39_017662 [Pinctada imbricata]|uniref:VWFA domain-containing protein n=1 Tax=Pinctada imbricata TaxID=66713 RepID=A0AA88YNY2_PINIB|nr:hypothetical protein FSP39_017662 [Pinctada imbricata]